MSLTTPSAMAISALALVFNALLQVEPVRATSILEPATLCREAAAIETLARSATRDELLDVAAWEAEFRKAVDAEHAKNMGFAQSANSFQHYQLAYTIDGYAAMAEATGNPDYVKGALVYVDEVIKSAVASSALPESRYQDGFRGWGAYDHPSDKSIVGNEYPLFESYFWRYVARLLRVTQEQGLTASDPVLKASYDDVLAFLETDIFDKWQSRGPDNIYRSRTHMASHWAYISLGISQLTEDVTRREQADAIVERINQALKDNMFGHPDVAGGYFWDARWKSSARPGQDVAHGNAVVSYLVEAAELGEGWTFEDLEALSLTLRDSIWQVDGGRDRYAAYVDGSGKGNGWFNDGFIKLGRISPDIQARLERHPIGRGTQFYGNAALNAHWMDVICE